MWYGRNREQLTSIAVDNTENVQNRNINAESASFINDKMLTVSNDHHHFRGHHQNEDKQNLTSDIGSLQKKWNVSTRSQLHSLKRMNVMRRIRSDSRRKRRHGHRRRRHHRHGHQHDQPEFTTNRQTARFQRAHTANDKPNILSDTAFKSRRMSKSRRSISNALVEIATCEHIDLVDCNDDDDLPPNADLEGADTVVRCWITATGMPCCLCNRENGSAADKVESEEHTDNSVHGHRRQKVRPFKTIVLRKRKRRKKSHRSVSF